MSKRRFAADRVRPITAATMHGDTSSEQDDRNHLDQPGALDWLSQNDKPRAPSPQRMAEMKRRQRRAAR